MNYNVLIIDDEPIAIRVIKEHLKSFPMFNLVGECSNALEAIEILATENIDLLFCDIQMPHITGVDFIRSLNNPPKVIFTTAYRDYAVEAFELNVVDYLLKPISFPRFAKSINSLLQLNTTNIIERDQHIFFKADKKQHRVCYDEIIYMESLGDYVMVFTETDKITVKDRIGHIVKMLPSDRFIQIHRGYVISIDKIKSVGSGFVEIGDKKLTIGRNYKDNLMVILGLTR